MPESWAIIIPRDSLPYLKRLFPDGCTLAFTQNKLQASSETVQFRSKLVQGPYPKTDKLIPSAADALRIQCDAGELSAMATRVAAIAGPDISWVTVYPRGDHILISSAGKADAEDALAAECAGSIDQITLSTKVLCPLLAGLGATRVRLSQAAQGAAVRIDSLEHTDRIGVAMPVYARGAERRAA